VRFLCLTITIVLAYWMAVPHCLLHSSVPTAHAMHVTEQDMHASQEPDQCDSCECPLCYRQSFPSSNEQTTSQGNDLLAPAYSDLQENTVDAASLTLVSLARAGPLFELAHDHACCTVKRE
jgi:hypothetical protein